ncbi:hypothetical protein R0K18_36720, partial [Pantoea sp. SIMBA_133]
SVPSSALRGLPAGSQQTFVVTAADVAGNTALTNHNVAIDTTLPVLRDISLSAGTSLNLAESLPDLPVNGHSGPGAQ